MNPVFGGGLGRLGGNKLPSVSITRNFRFPRSKKLRRVELIDYCLQVGRSPGRVDSEKDYPNRNLPKTLITNSILSMETLSE